MTFRRPAPPVETAWLDPRAAATYCGVHRETIRRAFRAGALQGYRVGRVLRIKRDDLDAWIAAGGRTSPVARVIADDNCGQLPDDEAKEAAPCHG